jgi:hypothetical protein
MTRSVFSSPLVVVGLLLHLAGAVAKTAGLNIGGRTRHTAST